MDQVGSVVKIVRRSLWSAGPEAVIGNYQVLYIEMKKRPKGLLYYVIKAIDKNSANINNSPIINDAIAFIIRPRRTDHLADPLLYLLDPLFLGQLDKVYHMVSRSC